MAEPINKWASLPEWKSVFCTHDGPCPGQPTFYNGQWVNGLNVYPHSRATGEIL